MKRHLLLTMLLLLAVTLFIPNIYATTANQQNSEISANTSTSNNITAQQQSTDNMQSTIASGQAAGEAVSVTEINQTSKANSTVSNTTKSSNNSQSTVNIQYAQAAAGDETFSNVQNNWFTTNNITEAAGRVKAYIEANHKLPNYVQMGTLTVTMPQFLQLLTTGLIQMNKGNTTPVTLKSVNGPTNSSESLKSGNINKTEYIDMAVRIQSYINSAGRDPNFANSTLGKISYQSLVYMYSRIMSYCGTNSVLPQYASIKPWESITNQTPSGINNQTPSGNATNDGFTIAQISAAAGVVKTFIEENQRLPNYVQINGKQVTMPQFLELLNTGLLQIDGNTKTPIALKSAGAPTNPSEDLESGNINKTEYIDMANRIQSYMDSLGKAPNFATSTLGKIRYESLIYLDSRILNFYAENNVLPKYAALNPWKTSDIPSTLTQYLQPTANCQSNDQRIISLAKSITAGKTSAYDKATAIFNWVSDNVEYSFYYNTGKGALGTLNSGSANCCDTSHLLIALTRAAGIPARYEQGICNFSDGTFGHVWAQVYVNGKWYLADAISSRNTFGVINNWDTSNWTLVGIYAELPF